MDLLTPVVIVDLESSLMMLVQRLMMFVSSRDISSVGMVLGRLQVVLECLPSLFFVLLSEWP